MVTPTSAPAAGPDGPDEQTTTILPAAAVPPGGQVCASSPPDCTHLVVAVETLLHDGRLLPLEARVRWQSALLDRLQERVRRVAAVRDRDLQQLLAMSPDRTSAAVARRLGVSRQRVDQLRERGTQRARARG